MKKKIKLKKNKKNLKFFFLYFKLPLQNKFNKKKKKKIINKNNMSKKFIFNLITKLILKNFLLKKLKKLKFLKIVNFFFQLFLIRIKIF